MKIYIREEPSTWVLDGDTFFCEHESLEIETCVENGMGFDGPYQNEYKIYVCSDCDSEVEGSPEEDAYDAAM